MNADLSHRERKGYFRFQLSTSSFSFQNYEAWKTYVDHIARALQSPIQVEFGE